MNGTTLILCYIIVFGSVYSCTYESEETEAPPDGPPLVYSGACDSDSVYFENHIMPILATRCGISSCHDDETQESDIIMIDYQSIMNSNIIVPGDTMASLIYQVINQLGGNSMPPEGEMTITTNQKDQLADWILQGAKYNSCTEVCDTSAVSYSNDILPIIEDRCRWCHGEGPNVAGGFLLVGYNHISTAALEGTILNAIYGQNGYEPMPPVGPPLTECQILLIESWIALGAPNN